MAKNRSKFLVSVENVEGLCNPGYKVGDSFEFTDLKTPPQQFCGGAYHSLFPRLFALHFGGKLNPAQEEQSAFVSCPDRGKVTFKITRIAHEQYE